MEEGGTDPETALRGADDDGMWAQGGHNEEEESGGWGG